MTKTLFTTLLFVCSTLLLNAQSSNNAHIIAFYNVENLFHPSNDSLTNDDDFTPTGSYHWTMKKYYHKLYNVAKVFIAMGEGNPPAIIGLAEIENEQVLKDLCFRTPLQKFGYRYVHYDSPDRRGVDVALLYRDSCVSIARSHPVPVVFPFEPSARNRDLLYVCAHLHNSDSLHLIVNHWTSRYGGYAPTIAKRNYYGDRARLLVDSLLADNPAANVLLMGDFNDYCTDESMTEHLKAHPPTSTDPSVDLFNLMFHFESLNNVGSHKHDDFWRCLDQIIVTRNLLNDTNKLHIDKQLPYIFDDDFLLVPDEKFGGMKTYRTFLGPRYIGGFADHLPVFVRILLHP